MDGWIRNFKRDLLGQKKQELDHSINLECLDIVYRFLKLKIFKALTFLETGKFVKI